MSMEFFISKRARADGEDVDGRDAPYQRLLDQAKACHGR